MGSTDTVHGPRREDVVVIDVERARRRILCAMLSQAGYEAIELAAPADLAARTTEGPPVLVLVDASPPQTFHEVVASVRAVRDVESRCPLAVTGKLSISQLSILARACNAAGWVEPSDDPLVVVRAVRRVIAAHRTRPSVPEWTVAAPVAPTARPRPAWGIVKLLLVDDSEIALELMQERLRHAKFDVRIAMALGEVQSILQGWSPNVIVVDVNMPEIRGDALCARLKAQVGQDVLVVLCSSMPHDELAAMAEASGADGFVSKAQGLDGFTDLVAAWCRRLSDPILSIQPTTLAEEKGGRPE